MYITIIILCELILNYFYIQYTPLFIIQVTVNELTYVCVYHIYIIIPDLLKL